MIPASVYQERAKLTCAVLDQIFSSYGKWTALALAAGRAKQEQKVYHLPEEVRQNLYAHNWESGACVAFAEEYLQTMAPLEPSHASLALRIIQQNFFGWERHAITQDPDGPAHLALVDSLNLLIAEDQNQ